MVTRGSLLCGGVEILLEPVGSHVVFVPVHRLPPYVTEDVLVQVLNQYGKVKAVTHATFRDNPDVRTGTQKGHIGPACKTPHCARCAVFGHESTGCKAPCVRCDHGHATAACTQNRHEARQLRTPGPPWRQRCTRSPQTTLLARKHLHKKRVTRRHRWTLQPRVKPLSHRLSRMPQNPRRPASPPGLTEGDTDSLSFGPGRLVIGDNSSQDSDAVNGYSTVDPLAAFEEPGTTPCKGNPPWAPDPPAVTHFADGLTPLPSGDETARSSSGEEEAMCCDRLETKCGLQSTSSGPDNPDSSTLKKSV
ncbi:hypothetical protein HPB47_002474 [Ixodes persulcatus]|uniref:Uncharacterized protein n=1 Tax=Ixodes persulcatus TaxID=34615 RepID=A0AC60PL64_IXOPE|nr:hypothetical protein HPB47_002474 [Ixodes persulcatus]